MKSFKAKRKVALLAIVAAAAVLFIAGNVPRPFVKDHQAVLRTMNDVFPEAAAAEIMDIVQIDNRHVFIPFKSRGSLYGIAFWRWEWFHWKLLRIDTRGEPQIWEVDESDPSSHRLVWNIDPADRLDAIDFYLIRERDASERHNGEEIKAASYIPRVQLRWSVRMQEKPYGASPYPEDWTELLKQERQIGSERRFGLFTWGWMQPERLRVGWMPMKENGETVFPEHSVNGSGYGNGNISTDHVIILNPSDLE